MFSDYYLESVERVNKALHFADEDIAKNGDTKNHIGDLVEKSTHDELSLQELALVSRSKDHVDFLEEKILEKYRSGEGEVKYIVPTFQTNNCIDICMECEWNRYADTKRVFLTSQQFETQINTLKNNGFGVIEISNGTSLPLLRWETLKDYMEVAKRHIDKNAGEAFGICSAVFDDDVLAKIFPEHAQFWVQWMETYDIPSYFEVQRFTKKIPENLQKFSKANFTSRLNSYDKVMELGGDVMLGVQYGLNPNDPAFDALMTIEHAKYLKREYGRKPLAFGTVKNNSCGDKNESYADGLGYNFSEEEYRTLLATYKLAEPRIGRWLNTRVPFELIQGVIVDGDFYTGECSNMVPGLREGLTDLTNKEAGQFKVFELDKHEWEASLRELGLGVNYAWMNSNTTHSRKTINSNLLEDNSGISRPHAGR